MRWMVIEWLLGPLLWAAVLIFFLGFGYQLTLYLRLIAQTNGFAKAPPGLQPAAPGRRSSWWRRLQVQLALVKSSPPAAHPLLTLVSTIFHLLIFVTPLFLLAHNLMLSESWGFALPSLQDSVSDALTVLVLICCLFFFLRRVLDPHARSISSRSDYLLLTAVAAPFVTGFFATHQWFAYRPLMVLHLATAELLIALIPFTKLMHMVFFFLTRLLGLTEYSYHKTRRLF